MLTCGCAFLAAMGLFAQTSQEMAAYFTQRIEHPSTFVPAQGASLSPEGLDAARANVWAAWQEANARLDEPRFRPQWTTIGAAKARQDRPPVGLSTSTCTAPAPGIASGATA